MGKMLCKCGNWMSNTVIPNDVEGVLIGERALFGEGATNEYEAAELGREVWECERCGRIHVEADGEFEPSISFVPEDGKYHGVVKRRPHAG